MPSRAVRACLIVLVAAATATLAGCADGPDGLFPDFAVAPAVGPDGYPIPEGPPAVQTDEITTFGEPPVVPAAYSGPPQAVADTDGPYLLDTGDRLRVFIYGQPNLSRSYTVDHDGRITVPLIGAVKARGRTTTDLEHAIRSQLAVEFVKDPQVTVDILQNRPFFILGEVKTAGQYPYVSGMTIRTAIAIAGGFSERASERSFRITRRTNGFVEEIDAPGDYIVRAGDTIEVFERFF